MKKIPILNLVVFIVLLFIPMAITQSAHAAPITCLDGRTVDKDGNQSIDEACGNFALRICEPKSNFLGLPTWYAYLPGKIENINGKEQCTPQLKCVQKEGDANSTANCDSQSGIDVSKLWLIALAILELLLRLAGLIAVFMVIYGGIKYITSQGQPDATKGARQTIINAMIGIVIAVIAAVSVNFGAKLLQ